MSTELLELRVAAYEEVRETFAPDSEEYEDAGVKLEVMAKEIKQRSTT